MGYYNVVKPCVVGKLHYVRPTTAPIEVDDDVAAPLVESGDLERYGAFSGPLLGDGIASAVGTGYVAPKLGVGFVESFGDPNEVEPESDVSTATGSPVRGPRGRRKAAED